jgi:thiol:disulfide interchange protein/DsbC/DsbD-like thiol-disulfide interchange protein
MASKAQMTSKIRLALNSARALSCLCLLLVAGSFGLGLSVSHAQSAPSGLYAQSAPSGLLGRLTAAPATDLPGPGPLSSGEVTVQVFAEASEIQPGATLRFGLLLDHAPGWHTYWRNPGDSGLPTAIVWQIAAADGGPPPGQASPVSIQASEIQWPTPKRMPVGPLASYGYEDQIFLVQSLQFPNNLPAGQTVQVLVTASWLVCKDVCIPGGASLSLEMPVRPAVGSPSPSPDAARFAQADRAQPVAAAVSPRYAFEPQNQRLVLLGGDPPEAVADGYFFIETEGLVVPAAAQALYRSGQGWQLEIPLASTANRAVRALQERPAVLYGVFRPAAYPDSPAVRWALSPEPADRASALIAGPRELVSAGQTAEQAYAGSRAAKSLGGQASGFFLAVALAFIGGLLLNLMPCVFPVLGLKVLAFSQQAHSPSQAWQHGLVFTLGVVVSMLSLASIFLGLRAAGEAVGWGFQLQNPWVVSLLALLFVAIALNLFGVFEIGLGLARVTGDIAQGLSAGSGSTQAHDRSKASELRSAFGSGVLAVVVASPCTAPFMGSALGYTATASVPASLGVFASLGLGLALPYMILAVWPRALALLPRPGAWMETFRQALGFPMLATAAWLGWVLAEQNGPTAVLALMLLWVCAALGLWVYGRWQAQRFASENASQWGKWLVMLLALLASLALLWQATRFDPVATAPQSARMSGGADAAESSGDLLGRPWEPGLAETLAAQGKVVFVDFTAAWCISYQANKARVLARGAVAQRLASEGHQLLVADWTRQDPRITQELNRHGRNGVPLYLVYGPGLSSPAILSEWLTESEVIQALDRAARRPAAPAT